MNKTYILAEARDYCYGICNHCEEIDCELNKGDNDD